MFPRLVRVIGRTRRGKYARLIASTTLALAAVTAMAVPVLACDIGIQPSTATGAVGDTVTFTITVEQTHRVCSVPIGDTQIYLSGMELVSQTPWEEVASGANQKEIVVKLTTAGEGRIEVVRSCSKGGDECVATVTINPGEEAVAPASSADEAEALAPAGSEGQMVESPSSATEEQSGKDATPDQSPDASTPAAAAVAPLPSESVGFKDSLRDALREPYILVLIALLALGTVGVARGYRKWRPIALLVSLGFLGFYVGGCPCPIGALQNSFIYFRDVAGHMVVYLQLAIVVVMTLLVGRVFCGWVCPMGAVQYFLYRRKKGRKPRAFDVTPEQHSILRWSKYGFLVILIVLVILTGQPVFQDIDPFKPLFNLEFSLGLPLVFLIILAIASVLIGFPFCKYVCPLGAFLGLLQPLSVFKIRFTDSCTNCGLCSRVACQYGAIERGDTCPTINQMECVRCGECVSKCPCGAITLTAKRQ